MLDRVVVTGASRGIGRAVAELLARRETHVIAIGRDRARLESLQALEGSIDFLQADLADAASADGLIDTIVSMYGELSGLVNCAGVIHYERWNAISAESVEEQFAVNTTAPLALSRAFAAHVRNREAQGSIVNVSSTLADRAAETTMVYAATKAAANALTRGLALELAPYGIRVNAVLPGVVDTDMVRVPRDAAQPSPDEIDGALERGRDDHTELNERLNALARLHPLGRLGTAEEVAAVVVQTLHNTWQTGSLVTIDGGLTLR